MSVGIETIDQQQPKAPPRPAPIAAGCFGLSRAVEAQLIAAKALKDCPSLEQFEARYIASERP